MCKVLAKEKAADLASKTVTCDGRHRQAEQPSQCGYCSSCLLRRLALATAQIEDQTEYVATHGTKATTPLRNLHFEAMQTQVKLLQPILNSENPWQDIIQRYPDLRTVASYLAKQEQVEPEIIQNKLLQMYRDHVSEWLHFQNTLQWEPNPSNNKVAQSRQLSMVW